MLQQGSLLKVLDNSGYQKVKLITVYKKKYKLARLCDLVLVSSTNKKAANLEKGTLLKALVVNTKARFFRKLDSTYIEFPENAVLIVQKEKFLFNSLGSRINGTVPLEILKFLNKKSRSKVEKVV